MGDVPGRVEPEGIHGRGEPGRPQRPLLRGGRAFRDSARCACCCGPTAPGSGSRRYLVIRTRGTGRLTWAVRVAVRDLLGSVLALPRLAAALPPGPFRGPAASIHTALCQAMLGGPIRQARRTMSWRRHPGRSGPTIIGLVSHSR